MLPDKREHLFFSFSHSKSKLAVQRLFRHLHISLVYRRGFFTLTKTRLFSPVQSLENPYPLSPVSGIQSLFISLFPQLFIIYLQFLNILYVSQEIPRCTLG